MFSRKELTELSQATLAPIREAGLEGLLKAEWRARTRRAPSQPPRESGASVLDR